MQKRHSPEASGSIHCKQEVNKKISFTSFPSRTLISSASSAPPPPFLEIQCLCYWLYSLLHSFTLLVGLDTTLCDPLHELIFDNLNRLALEYLGSFRVIRRPTGLVKFSNPGLGFNFGRHTWSWWGSHLVTVLKGGSYMAVSCCHYHQFIEFGFSARAEDSARAENNFCTNEPSYREKCHAWWEMPRVIETCRAWVVVRASFGDFSKLQDLGLLGVAYLIVESPKLVMGHDRYKAIYGIFCPILEPEWWWIHNRRTASILYYLIYFIKDFTGAQNSPAIMVGSELNVGSTFRMASKGLIGGLSHTSKSRWSRENMSQKGFYLFIIWLNKILYIF